MNLDRLFYFHEHRQAVHATFREILRPSVKLIGVGPDAIEMRGIRGGTFLTFYGHSARIPDRITEVIEHDGWVVIRLDDSSARELVARRVAS